jgi:hypothetical protein
MSIRPLTHVDLIDPTVDLLEGLFRFCLEREQVPVHALELLVRNANEPSSSPTRRFKSRISASMFMLATRL